MPPMTTFTICCCSHDEIEHQATEQDGYEPTALDTFPTREAAERRVQMWTEEDGDQWLYWVAEGSRPVTLWETV